MEVVGRIRERHMFDCGRLLISILVAIILLLLLKNVCFVLFLSLCYGHSDDLSLPLRISHIACGDSSVMPYLGLQLLLCIELVTAFFSYLAKIPCIYSSTRGGPHNSLR